MRFVLIVTILAILATANGEKIKAGFAVQILRDKTPLCSGGLISKVHVITSCLCLRSEITDRIFVKASEKIPVVGKNAFIYYATDFISIHPECVNAAAQYSPSHDLSLIRLTRPIKETGTTFEVAVPRQIAYYTPDSIAPMQFSSYTVGSNKHVYPSSENNVFHNVNERILSPRACKKKMKEREFFPGEMICATYHHKNGKDYCETDLGAPLVFNYKIFGVLVHKHQCGGPNDVASYVNIPYNSKWIREEIRRKDPFLIV